MRLIGSTSLFQYRRRPLRAGCVLWALWLWASSLSCASETVSPRIRIQVLAGAPVADARVLMWWVNEAGHPLRRDERPSASAELLADNALAQGYTDERGVVELETGPAYGLLVLAAHGGQTTDPWIEAEEREDGGDEDVPVVLPLDVGLTSVVVDFNPADPRWREIVISPLTTLASRLGEGRLAHPLKERTYMGAMRRAYELLGHHLGDIELARGPVPAADQPLATLDAPAQHAVALHALSSLAHRIARASGLQSRGFHTLDLLRVLIEDAGDDRALLDGEGREGPITAGPCPVPDGCSTEAPGCRAACALGPHTMRADLASALAFDFLPSSRNRTTLSIEELRGVIEHIRTNAEPELFGSEPGAPLDGPAPIVEVRSSPVVDERQDSVTFAAGAVPVHTPGEDAQVDLGRSDRCPTVGKHIHRLDDPGENPLRWEVTVSDRSGWAGGGEIVTTLAYRVRYRETEPSQQPGATGASSAAACDAAESAWLTDWLDARPIGSVEGGTVYEALLLDEHLPELATEPYSELEIVFRGADALGRERLACRCWNHLLLPAPIEASELAVATGPGSLETRTLHPGNNLAPLLNGVSPDQGAILATFELRNGTDAATYASLSVEQPLVYFTKCWRRTNHELSFTEDPDRDCIVQEECLSEFPPDRQTAMVVDTGVMESLVSGVRVLDVTVQPAVEIARCDEGCGPDQYRLEPRLATGQPRTYHVDLLVTDLGALAPRTSGDLLEIYEEATLDPPDSVTITGVLYNNTAYICTNPVLLSIQYICRTAGVYRYYRALRAVELQAATPLTVHATMIPALQPHAGSVASLSLGLETYEWSTYEPYLPNTIMPPLTTTESIPCPIGQESQY